MISNNNSLQQYVCRYFLQNSRIIKVIKQLFKFCDILNFKVLLLDVRFNQPRAFSSLITLYILITKTSSNIYLNQQNSKTQALFGIQDSLY